VAAVATLLHIATDRLRTGLSKADCDDLRPVVSLLVPPTLSPGQLALLERAGRLKPIVDWMAETSFFAEDGAKLKSQLEVRPVGCICMGGVVKGLTVTLATTAANGVPWCPPLTLQIITAQLMGEAYDEGIISDLETATKVLRALHLPPSPDGLLLAVRALADVRTPADLKCVDVVDANFGAPTR
jgi:hypothetical protein